MSAIEAELSRLTEAICRAEEEKLAAQEALRRSRAGALDNEAVQNYVSYDEDVFYGRFRNGARVTEDPQKRRDLLCTLARELLVNEDLTLSMQGHAFRVDNLAPARRAEAARKGLADASRERDRYYALHKEELEHLERARRRAETQSALDSGDVKRIRDVLGLNQKTLTTDSLAG